MILSPPGAERGRWTPASIVAERPLSSYPLFSNTTLVRGDVLLEAARIRTTAARVRWTGARSPANILILFRCRARNEPGGHHRLLNIPRVTYRLSAMPRPSA